MYKHSRDGSNYPKDHSYCQNGHTAVYPISSWFWIKKLGEKNIIRYQKNNKNQEIGKFPSHPVAEEIQSQLK
jgi:hypothetical protein